MSMKLIRIKLLGKNWEIWCTYCQLGFSSNIEMPQLLKRDSARLSLGNFSSNSSLRQIQVDNYQKVSFVYRFIIEFYQNWHDSTVQNDLSTFSLNCWKKGAFARLLTCTLSMLIFDQLTMYVPKHFRNGLKWYYSLIMS